MNQTMMLDVLMPERGVEFAPRSYSVPEVKVMAVRETTVASASMMRPEHAADFFRSAVKGAPWWNGDQECFVVLLLDRKNKLKGWNLVTLGTATSSLAHPREVFRAAIAGGAVAIVCIHNHPSGDPAPSAADCSVTRQLREAAKVVDIDLVDHVIVGDSKADPRGMGYYSFREAGLL